jgi:uncharacterized membrane protein
VGVSFFACLPSTFTGKEVILVTGLESFWISYWWVFLLFLMVLCCVGMKGRKGFGICGSRSWGTGTREIHPTDSAIDILDKRYALGEISREEYEERKRTIGQAGA